MKKLLTVSLGLWALGIGSSLIAAELTGHELLAKQIFKELIEINTTDSQGDNTVAARAMAQRLLDAGYPPQDVQVIVPRERKGNLVARLRSPAATARPIVLLAHIDVVEADPSDLFWSFDGGKIHYIDKHDHLLAVDVTVDPQLSVSKPQSILDVGELRTADDELVPLPDGERFVFIQKGDEERDVEHLNVVLNWFEELKKKVPTQVTQADRPGI